MNFNDDLNNIKDLVDSELNKVLKDKIGYQERIYKAIDYSLLGGGKRLRPILIINTYQMFKDNLKEIMPLALGIEMIHTYSLIHDDLPSMDNDDFRRGKPTNHIVFGEAMAILAGDGLLNLAFETMLDHAITSSQSMLDYKKYLNAIKEISNYSGIYGMIGGQVVDLLSGQESMNEDKLKFMYQAKTAGLIQACMVAGAIIGEAKQEEIEALRKFGLYLGLLYQIRDDLLDFEQDEKIDKLTYLKFHDRNKVQNEINLLRNNAIDALNSLSDRNTEFFINLTNLLIDNKNY